MLVGKDHVGGEGSCWLWKIVSIPEVWFRHRKNTFFAQNGSPSVRSQQKSQQTICQLAPDLLTNVARSKIQVDVEIIGKLWFVRVLLNLFPQQYYYYYYDEKYEKYKKYEKNTKKYKIRDGLGDHLGALRGSFGSIFGRFSWKYFSHIFLYFPIFFTTTTTTTTTTATTVWED